METPNQPSEQHEPEKRRGPGPRLFFITLGIIVAALVIFLILSPAKGGSGAGGTTASPGSQR